MKNQQVMDAFDLNSQTLNKLVNQFATKSKGAFNLQEFAKFLQSQKNKRNDHTGHESFGGLSQIAQSRTQQSACLLKSDQIKQLQKVFDRLDSGGQMVVERTRLLQELRNDINVIRMLHLEAAYVPSIDKILSLEKVLQQIEQATYSSDNQLYISWNQFLDYFNSNEADKSKIAYAQVQSQITDNVDDQDKIDLSMELQKMIKLQFDQLDKQEESYCETLYVTDAIRRHPLYSENKNEIARQKAKKFSLKNETLKDVLNRIDEEAHEFVMFPELMTYFTRRGRPKFEEGGEGGEEFENMARSINVTQNTKQNVIDGYDSDPEIHTYQDKLLPRQRFGRQKSVDSHITYSHRFRQQTTSPSHDKVQASGRLQREDFLKAIQPKTTSFGAQYKPSDYNYTFDSRERDRSLSIRQRKLQEMLDQKKQEEDDHLNHHFKPKEVPQSVKEPLFERILQANEARRLEVKKNSVAITLQNQKPFSFYNRPAQKPRRKNYWERERFVFKAKVIPWHVHVNLYHEMINSENLKRQEKIAKHAQELAMSSKMPARMERHKRIQEAEELDQGGAQEKLMKKYYQHTHQPAKAKQMPDFEKLHSTFQDQLEKKKQSMRTTEAKEFNFGQSHKGARRDYLDQENVMTKMTLVAPKVDKIEEARNKMSKKPMMQPASTKKWEAILAHNKQEDNKKREKLKQLDKEEKARKDRKEKFKSRVQNCKEIQNNTAKLKEAEEKKKTNFQKQQVAEKEKFKAWKQERLQNASNQPLLIERPLKRDVRMEKMKQLAKFNKILDKNGIKNKDEYFNKEEKEMIDDMEYLKKQGYAEDFENEDDPDNANDQKEPNDPNYPNDWDQ